MALETYDDLKAEIASYVARSDVTSASASVDTFIDLAEARLNKKLRVLRMRDDLSLTTVAGTPTVDLPADFLEVHSLGYTEPPKNIEYLPKSQFKKLKNGEVGGRPVGCTLKWSGTVAQLLFCGTPDAEYEFDGEYYAKIPALSSSNATNWLLNDYPELYLNSCLYFAFKRFRSPLAADYRALMDDDISTLNNEDEDIQTIGGGMRIIVSGTIV